MWKWDQKLKILISLHISSIAPIIWGKCFPIVREKYEKTEHSKVECFLHISREAEIHTIPKTQNMGKVNFHSTEKCGKTQTFQIYEFLKYFGWIRNPYNSQNVRKVDSHSTEKYGKTQTFQSYRHLKYFGWHRKLYNSQHMKKVDFHSTGKLRENTNISNLWVS